VLTIINPPQNYVLPPFFDHNTICFRHKVVGTPWTCFPTIPTPLPAPQLLALCTHNP
jgi:hypothetical protein